MQSEKNNFYDENSVIYAKAAKAIEVGIDDVVKERNRARAFNFLLVISLIICVSLSTFIISTKELIPVLVKYNEITGDVTVSKIEEQTITNESIESVLHKHWIGEFINCAETYDYGDSTRLFNCAINLVNDDVYKQIDRRYSKEKTDNWFARYGKENVVIPKILSINQLPTKDSEHRTPEGERKDALRWIVKFSKIKMKNGKEVGRPIIQTAYLETKMYLLAREIDSIVENPLDFRIIHYRPEYVAD